MLSTSFGIGSPQQKLLLKVINLTPYTLEHVTVYSSSLSDIGALESPAAVVVPEKGRTTDDLISFTVNDKPFAAYLPEFNSQLKRQDTLRITISDLDLESGVFLIETN